MTVNDEGTVTGAPDVAAAAPRPGDSPVHFTHKQILVILSGLMTGMLLAALDQTIVSTALRRIVDDFHGLNHYSWVVTAYLLTSTASTPLYGKISDLYGRRPVFQFAIVVFLVGSLLAGASQNMGQLIATRAIQGIGAGGLMALTFAIIGDIIPPRERGRYQGYFGAVWGLSSVAGPLLGGFFSDAHQILGITGWRWIFYVNLPFGIAALVITSIVLKIPHTRREHSIDFTGATLLVVGVVSLLLGIAWSGPDPAHGWGDPLTIGLIVVGAVMSVVFVWWEGRAKEPILPLHLFKIGVFSTTSAVGFIFGAGMFGSIVYLPLYLQVVKGASATSSGLQLLPLMLGILTTSILSGRLITRTGRYKVYPIVGTAMLVVGFVLLTRLGVHTPAWQLAGDMLVIGGGLGLVMQVLIIAVQNAVDFRDMGVATSANTFFRSMGGTFGTAALGTVFANALSGNLKSVFEHLATTGALRPGAAADIAAISHDTSVVKALPTAVRVPVLQAFVDSFHTVFWVSVPVALLAFGLAWAIKELPLRGAAQSAGSASPDAEVPLEPAGIG